MDRWLSSFPPITLMENPWFSLFWATIEAYRGKFGEAKIWVNNSKSRFIQAKDSRGLGESQILEARILRSRGLNQESLALLSQAELNLGATGIKNRFDLTIEKA